MKTKHLSNKTECLHAHKGWRLSDVFRWKIGMVLACLLFGMGSTMAATLWNYDGTINGGAQGTSFPLTEDGNWNTLSISRNSMNNGANAFLQNNDGFSFNLISGTCEGGLTISTDGNSASVTGLNSGTANFTVYVRVASGSKVIDISCQPPCPEPTFNTNGNLPSPAPTAPAIQCYRTEGSYGYGTLNINASVSSGAISYQWEKSKNGTSNWEAVSGNSSYNGKTSTFSPTATDITIGDNFFRCIVYNSTSGNQNCSSIISNVSANHQVINTAPTAASIPAGGATFCSTGITGSITVTPTAAGTITYQWQKSKTENGGWSNATGSGATTETLTLSGTDATEGNNYFRCNVTNACGTISSNVTNNYKVETAAAGNISPVGTINLCAANGTLGGTLTVSVTGTGYQWQRNTGAGWSNVPSNGNSQTYTIPASDLTAGVNNQYRCIVTNACGAINSNPSTTYTLTPELAVSLDANSTPIIKCSGTYPSLSVTTTAGVASSYKWYRVGTATNTGGEEIQGAASATYAPPATVAGKTLEGDNYYYCAVTSSACGEPQTTAVSANYPVAITATSTNQTIEVGDNLPLLTPAFGWVSSNTAVATVSGGNIRGLSIGTATLTNTQGDCTSSPITVTVNGRGCSVAPKVEAISGRGASNIQCLGECAGGYMYSYTHAGGNWGELEIVGIPRNQSGWNYFGGIQSSIDWNQSVPNLTIRAEATPVSNTIYYLIINQTNLTITRYTVAEKPECSCVTGSLQGQEICGDETFEELDVLASEPGITYQWYVNETDSDQNGTRLEGETNQTFTPTKTGKTFGKAYYYYCVVMRDDTECGRIKSGAHIVIKTCPDCDNNRFHIRTWGDQVSIGSINSVSANKATRQITPLCAVDACATIFEFTVESNGADANFGIYEGPTSPDNEFNRVIHYPGDDYNSASAIDGASGLAYNRCGDYATSGDNNPTIGCLIYTPNLLNKTTYWLVVDGTNPPYVTSTRPEAIESEVCPEPDVCASFTAPFIPYVIQVGDEINLPDHTNWWLTNGSDVDEVVIPNTSLGTLTGSLSGYAHLAYKKEIDGKSCEKQITIKVQDCNPPAIGNDVNVNQTAPAVREGTGYSWTARTLQVQGVSVEGGGNITYTWYRTTEATAPASNAVPRAGDVEVKTVTNNTNTDSYTPNNLTEAGSPLPANDYRYYCVVSTGSTCNAVSRISGVFSVTEACKDFTIGIEGSSVLSATICAAELPLTFEVKGINPVPAGAWSSSNTSAAIINATTGVVTAGTIAGTTQIRYTQTGCDAVEFPLEVFTSPSISPLLEGETPFQTCANNGLFETELSTSITGSGSYSFQWFRTANKSNPDADKVAVTDTAGTSIYVPTSNENAGIVTGTTYYYFVEAWNNRAGAPINGCRVRSNISIGYLATSGRCDGLTDEIAVTPTISNQFSYAQGEGPSIYQEFILKHGDNITDETDVWIGGTNANAFEYRIGNTGSWTIGNELTRLEAGVQGQDVTIYVRLKAGLLNDNSPFSATLNFLNPSNTVPAIILNGSVRRSAETDCGITDRDDEFYSIDRPASPGYSAYGKDHYLVVSPVGGTYALGGSNNASELPGGSLYIENPTGTLVLQGGGGYTGTDVQNQRFNSATFYVTASGTVNDSAKVTINLNSCTGIVILDGTYVVYTLISPTGLTELRINEGIRVNINENLASERNYSIYNRGDVVIDGDFTFNGGMFFNNGSLDTKGAFTPTNNQHAKFVNNGIAYSNSIQFSGGQVCLATGSCFFSRGNLTLDAAFGEEEAKLGTPDQRGLTGGGGLHVQGNYATGSGAYLINKTDGGTLGRRTFVRNGESTVLTVSETSEANNGKEFSTESNAGLTDLGTDIEVGISQYGCAACFMVDDTNFSFEDSICAGAEANVHVIADASPYLNGILKRKNGDCTGCLKYSVRIFVE